MSVELAETGLYADGNVAAAVHSQQQAEVEQYLQGKRVAVLDPRADGMCGLTLLAAAIGGDLGVANSTPCSCGSCGGLYHIMDCSKLDAGVRSLLKQLVARYRKLVLLTCVLAMQLKKKSAWQPWSLQVPCQKVLTAA